MFWERGEGVGGGGGKAWIGETEREEEAEKSKKDCKKNNAMKPTTDTSGSTTSTPKPKMRRFNDERIRQAIQSHYERILNGPRPLTRSGTGTLEVSDVVKSQLPPIRCTPLLSEVPEYYRVMKTSTLCSALLGWCAIVVAFVEGEITGSNTYRETWLEDCLRGLNIVLSLLQVAFILRFYQTLMKTRVARGLVYYDSNRYPASLVSDPEIGPYFIAEVVLALLVSPPCVYVTIDYLSFQTAPNLLSVADLIFGLTCIRFYQLLKLLYWRMRNPRDFFYL